MNPEQTIIETQARFETALKDAARDLISVGYSPDEVKEVIDALVEDEL